MVLSEITEEATELTVFFCGVVVASALVAANAVVVHLIYPLPVAKHDNRGQFAKANVA
nr:hypothetical protein [Desulfobulbaceae bacterium]